MNEVFSSATGTGSKHVFTGEDVKLLPDGACCTVLSGTIRVVAAQIQNGNPVQPLVTIATIQAENAIRRIPGFSATTPEGEELCFVIAGLAGTEVEISPKGATAVMRRSFMNRDAKLPDFNGDNYNECICNAWYAAQTMQLDGSSRVVTQDGSLAWKVLSGEVYVLVAKLEKNGEPHRAIPFAMVKTGDVFPAFNYRTYGTYEDYAFVLIGRKESELEAIPEKGNDPELRRQFALECQRPKNSPKTTESIYAGEGGYEGFLVDLWNNQELEESLDILKAGKQSNRELHDNLDQLFFDPPPIPGNDPLYRAAAAAMRAAGIQILSEKELTAIGCPMDIASIANASRAASRNILLDGTLDWFKNDTGVFVTQYGEKEDAQPVAIIPRGWNGYDIYYGRDNCRKRLTADVARQLDPCAYSICRALPGGKLTKKDLYSFGMKTIRKGDLAAVLVLALVGVIIGVILPTMNQWIYDQYIPLGDKSLLAQLCFVIASFMVCNLFFSMVKSLSEYRIGSRIGYSLQNAVYYRVFHLKQSFFSDKESADLSARVSSISSFSSTLVNMVLVSGVGILFSLVYLWRMFTYASKLAWIAILMLVIYTGIEFALNAAVQKMQAEMQRLDGIADSKMYQFLSAVDKIRLSGSEERAAGEFLKPYKKIQDIAVRSNRITALSSVISGSASTIFSMIFYWIIARNSINLSAGQFVAFNSAFGSFSAAFLQLAGDLQSLYQLKPQYQRFVPIMEAEQEDDGTGKVVTDLRGQVSLRNVSFAYDKKGRNVLNDISLDIKPGEYVGIVGGSGCGKSTLLKLLLGFEQPDQGAVYYDDMNLKDLDKRSLRKKLGVALQGGQLIDGSIMENITITDPTATRKKVMDVVERAGLKEDIEGMPMGLQTMVSTEASTISGGQKQRVLIARAIINDPKVLIFDEATSALDNITQAIVCSSLEKMHVTRIVVAHRLSTVRDCDRIIVLDAGRIAEEGNFDALMAKKGIFYRFAARQIADMEGV